MDIWLVHGFGGARHCRAGGGDCRPRELDGAQATSAMRYYSVTAGGR